MTGTKELESFRTVLSTWPNTDFEITDTVVKFGEFLGDRPPLMRELYKLIKLKKSQYEYNSLLGTTILLTVLRTVKLPSLLMVKTKCGLRILFFFF